MVLVRWPPVRLVPHEKLFVQRGNRRVVQHVARLLIYPAGWLRTDDGKQLSNVSSVMRLSPNVLKVVTEVHIILEDAVASAPALCHALLAARLRYII